MLIAACARQGASVGSSTADSATERNTEVTDNVSDSERVSDDNSENIFESESETNAEVDTETNVPLTGPDAELVSYANSISGKITMGFTEGKRDSFTFANSQVSLGYNTYPFSSLSVSYLNNSKGKSYLENAMDVFVTMKSGNRYYASSSISGVDVNAYRIGYYYYDVRLENQDFLGQFNIVDEKVLPLKSVTGNHIKTKADDSGLSLTVSNGASDPYIIFGKSNGVGYDYLQITMRSTADESNENSYRQFRLFARTGDENFSHDKYMLFNVYPDGEFHTYYIPIFTLSDVKTDLQGIRIDIDHYSTGDAYEISEAKLIKTDNQDAPDALSISRTFHLYSDKLHQTIQFSSDGKDTPNIANVGMETKLPADSVAAIVIHDINGDHSSLDGVDFASVEYLAFDIKGVGIIGYILPYDEKGGSIKVTLNDGIYTVEQSVVPDGNVIKSSEPGTLNQNDLFFGARIYTDESHSFSAFLSEAENERTPLTRKDIKVRTTKSTENASFLGYDSLRGIYSLYVDGDNFNNPQYQHPNKHFPVNFTICSREVDRNIYIMAYNDTGYLECSVLLNKNMMMLPVPVEVIKNFSGDGDANLYNLDDAQFSESIIPLTLKANEEYQYTIVNLYQNWGAFPLKQISAIAYLTPYYHLSIGTTESNCLVPWYNTNSGLRLDDFISSLPDHRGLSAPLWLLQPQHNYAGFHNWLEYTDSNGNYNASECYSSFVESHGPVYADVSMNYTTDDGKIKLSYNHMEMPQTDENRGYYEISYEILEDVSFSDFAKDFAFYTVRSLDPTGYYTKVGYLDENNVCRVQESASDLNTAKYVLGDISPYFSFFDMDNYSSTSCHNYDSTKSGYGNVSFIIKDYDIKLANASSPRFAIVNENGSIRLTLDIGEITLKAGDTISFNAILMPWGSQEMEEYGNRDLAHAYTDVIDEKTGELYMDKNVRDVRETSCLDPFTVSSKTDEVLASAFLGKVRSNDGKSAEFTLSGGENNMVVRVYGLSKLTVPVIEELVEGEWVTYNVSSFYSPDYMGNYHQYDGYGVYYDGDGSYSYAFAVDMTGDVERTFRVTAVEDFAGWPKETPELPVDPLTLYFNAMKLNAGSTDPNSFSSSTLMTEGSKTFTRIGSKSTRGESYFTLYKHTDESTEAPLAGRYLVMRYRLPATNSDIVKNAEFYLSTSETAPAGNNSLGTTHVLVNDGEWHVLILDMVGFSTGSFEPDDKGEYRIKLLRWDVFNAQFTKDVYFDIEYIGFDNDLEKIIELNSDLKTVTLMPEGNKFAVIDTKSGETVSDVNPAPLIKPKPSDVDSHVKMELSLEEMRAKFAAVSNCFSNVEIVDNSYLRAKPTGNMSENYATVYSAGNKVTGQYLLIKYRVPTTNQSNKPIEIYTSTVGMDGIQNHSLSMPVNSDGEWHVAIIDLSRGGKNEYFTVNEDGKFVASYLRLDILNYKATTDEYIDIASVAFFDDLSAAVTYDQSLTDALFYDQNGAVTVYSTSNGQVAE